MAGMAVPYQRLIVGGLWAVFLADGIRQGLLVPSAYTPNEEQYFWVGALFGLLAPPLIMVPSYLSLRSRPYDPGRISRWVDRRWGQGSALSFLQTLRPVLLIGCAGLILGAVGLISCLVAGSSKGPYGVALFFLFAGGWFVLGSVWLRRQVPHSTF
jgi:hypothetical protein